jgi:hypothetical protein
MPWNVSSRRPGGRRLPDNRVGLLVVAAAEALFEAVLQRLAADAAAA